MQQLETIISGFCKILPKRKRSLVCGNALKFLYISRGGEVVYLAVLISRRSQVRILPAGTKGISPYCCSFLYIKTHNPRSYRLSFFVCFYLLKFKHISVIGYVFASVLIYFENVLETKRHSNIVFLHLSLLVCFFLMLSLPFCFAKGKRKIDKF